MAATNETGLGENYLPLEFDEQSIPEMSESENGVRALDVFVDASEEQELMSQLEGLRGSDALVRIDEFTDRKALEALQSANLPAGILANAQEVVRARNFANVKSEGESFALVEFAAKLQRVKYALIERWAQTGEKTGLNEVGRAEYVQLAPAMAACDRLYIKMKTEKFPIDSDERTIRGLTNAAAVVREVDGSVVEVPMHEAYPEDVAAILDAYDKLIAELEGRNSDKLAARKLPYYRSVRDALASSDINKWLRADTLLAGQILHSSDVFHVHPIETDYMTDRILRVPEISLRAPDASAENVRILSDETKAFMLDSWQSEHLAEMPGIQKSLPLLQMSNSTPRRSVSSGSALTFRTAGQIIPNDFEPRSEGGIDSTIDQTTAVQRFPEYVDGFKRLFGEDMYEKIFKPTVNHERISGVDTAAHEFGHTTALIASTYERLGGKTLVNPYIEEWKATAAGMVGRLYIPHIQGKLPKQELVNKIPFIFGRAGRYANKRASDYAAGYFRKSIMLCNVMQEVGILEETGDAENPWDIDLAEDKVLKFYEVLFEQFKKVVEMYDSGTEEDLRAFLGENLTITPFVQYMFDRIPCTDNDGKNRPGTTAAEIVRLPRTESQATPVETVTAGVVGTNVAVDSVLAKV